MSGQGTGNLSRRDFLKLMGAAGTGLAFAPFVPWGTFLPVSYTHLTLPTSDLV